MLSPDSKYDVSVIIPTYNRSQLLTYSLNALTRQSIDKNRFEVIIADDGSTDDTRETVRQFEDRLNVKYVYQEDRGYRPGSARNMGIRAAEGFVCVFIDSGVILTTNCLAEHIGFYAQMGTGAANVGYVYGFDRTKESEEMLKKLVVFDDPDGSVKRLLTDPIFTDVREDHYVKYNYKIHELPAAWFYFWTCHVSATKLDLMSAGLFDKNFDGKWGVEDNELGYRLNQNGVRIHLLRAAEAIHYPHPKDKEERRVEGYQNCLYFHEKHQSPETAIFLNSYMNSEEFVDVNKLIMEIQVLENVK